MNDKLYRINEDQVLLLIEILYEKKFILEKNNVNTFNQKSKLKTVNKLIDKFDKKK